METTEFETATADLAEFVRTARGIAELLGIDPGPPKVDPYVGVHRLGNRASGAVQKLMSTNGNRDRIRLLGQFDRALTYAKLAKECAEDRDFYEFDECLAKADADLVAVGKAVGFAGVAPEIQTVPAADTTEVVIPGWDADRRIMDMADATVHPDDHSRRDDEVTTLPTRYLVANDRLPETLDRLTRLHGQPGTAVTRDQLTAASQQLFAEHAEWAKAPLIQWAANNARRDQIIRAAADTGVTKMEIHQITGIARTTIDRILADR